MCHFCNAQLFEITHAENIKSPLEQPSCQDAKVVEAFCNAAWRLSTPCRLLGRQPPFAALRVPAEMPAALHSHIASGWRHAFHRGRRQHAILIAPAALSVPHTPRLRALVHFGRRPIRRGDGSSLPASEMLHNKRLSHCKKGREDPSLRERTSSPNGHASFTFHLTWPRAVRPRRELVGC
jgi:hypothetical protein